MDAAVAAAACLTVVEPTSNGIGGDAFALGWVDGALFGLNASGRSPAAMTQEHLRTEGYQTIPERGWESVTTPGTPSAWAALSERFGRLDFAELFRPAIMVAEEGHPILPFIGKHWRTAAQIFGRTLVGPEFEPWFDTFTRDGAAPGIGSMVRLPDHADTLREIARSGGRSFYEGALAERIDAAARAADAPLTGEDLARHAPEWVDPVSVRYGDYDVWELPPPGQGIVALQALKIFEALATRDMPEALRQHYLVEALKVAFVDARGHVGDPAHVSVPVAALLSEEYAARRAAGIGAEAGDPVPVKLREGGTVYLATADRYGNMVSFIQSNYKGFGSAVVVPGTGIALHNRAKDFSLDPNHPDALAPGKRPFHTIIPGFLTREGAPAGPFGVMGGYMQPQGHVQVLTHLFDGGRNPQAGLDAPRWRWEGGRKLSVEPEFPSEIADTLAERGHEITREVDETGFGRGQVILRDADTGVLAGGSEPRADGEAGVL